MGDFFHDFSAAVNVMLKKTPNFNKPTRIQQELKKIEQRYEQVAEQPLSEEYQKVCKKILDVYNNEGEKSLSNLPPKYIRMFPWFLFIDDNQMINRLAFCRAILSVLDKKAKSNLNTIITVYLLSYNKQRPETQLIEEYIKEKLSAYNGVNPRLKSWKEKYYMFTPHGVNMVVSKLTTAKLSENYLGNLGFRGNLETSEYLHQVLREFFINENVSLNQRLECLESFMYIDRQSQNIRFADLIPLAANSMLLSAGSQAKTEIQDRIRPFLLKHLKDPRLPGNRVRWHGVSEQAQAIFKYWVSKKDLDFFFNFVEQTAVDRVWKYRRKFWESYLPYAENTWIALGTKARGLVKFSMRGQNEEREYGTLTSGASQDQSIFLFEMKGYIFVEWSHSGKLRVWEKESFPFEFGKREYPASKIRDANPEYEQTHHNSEIYSWQRKVAHWIQRNCGVSQVRSYYII